jgi:two-component system, OmpR family, KDP operon response regulator KdpE
LSHILVVEDEQAICRLLGAILTRGGHQAQFAATGRDALAQVERCGIDAILLDLGLPDRDGLEMIGAIRARHDLPIIVVTARGETAEKIAALDLGADDYVTKPFDGDELLARLRSALRRARGSVRADNPLEFGPIVLDIARHEARCRGQPVNLTPREYAVLQALVEAGGRVLTHKTLLERVWGKAHGEDIDYLRVVVRALRLKLERDPAQPGLIRNEPGIGYRLKPD